MPSGGGVDVMGEGLVVILGQYVYCERGRRFGFQNFKYF